MMLWILFIVVCIRISAGALVYTKGNYEDCSVKWDRRSDTSAWGGVAQSGVGTVDECLLGCVDKSHCVGVDVDLNGGAYALCWYHFQTSDMGNTRPVLGIASYVLLSRCDGSPFSTIPVSTPIQVCFPLWDVLADTHAPGGRAMPDVITPESCRQTCVDDVDGGCVAVDIDSNPGVVLCWLHYDAASLERIERKTNTVHHRLVDRCPPITTTRASTGLPPSCQNTWELREHTHRPGGVQQTHPDHRTCLQICASDPQCQAVDLDYNPGYPFCWFHLEQIGLDETEFASNVDSYRLLDRCG